MLFAVILFLFSNVYIDFVHIKDILKYFKIDAYEQVSYAISVYFAFIGGLVGLTLLAQAIACKLVPFDEDEDSQ